jgi:hypothetical protein
MDLTLAKINQSHQNANWKSLLQNNKASLIANAEKMANKGPKNCK